MKTASLSVMFTILLILPFLPLSSDVYSLSLGGIVDYVSREGREEKVAMEMAIDEFCAHFSHFCPTLLVDDYKGTETAFLASSIIKGHQVKAIFMGTESWQNALIVAELGNKYQVPILSLANQVPNSAAHTLPFLVKAARSQHAEMKAVAAIIRSWQWKKVNVIYEDIDSVVAGIIPYLIEAIQEAGSEISTLLPLPTFQDNILEKLDSLKKKQCRVFIVHTNSINLAAKIFKEAKSLGMMEEDSVWITTTSITNRIDSLDASVISSMEGVVGFKSYFLKSGKRYENFHSRFKVKYGLQHPHEKNLEPGIFALQAYDATWAMAIALERKSYGNVASNATGKELLESILESDFSGLSGSFRFNSSTNMLDAGHVFEIINVNGKSYRELGFWSEGLGFSKSVNKGSNYSTSMRLLGQVVWPGGPWTVPRGWEVAKTSKPLRIGVPATTTFTEFVNVRHDDEGNPIVGGYSIDVFKAIVRLLPYHLPYEFVPFSGPSYDSMVQQVQLEVFDGVVADTAIIANRCSYVEFSQPYADSGLQMLIHYNPRRLDRTWLFIRPFTPGLWLATVGANIFNGLAIWLMERKKNPERYGDGSLLNQIGIMLYSSFNTLFSQHGRKLSTNASRIALIVWSFVGLVITQSFTANLTTLLTVEQLEPTKVDIETLKNTGAKVGCDGNSFVVKYLEEALGFKPHNIIKIHAGDDYPLALESGRIAAAFLEVPYVKLFLAKYCDNFTTSGAPLKVGGFGFAFPKSSPYLPDISQAILKLTENGTLLQFERSMLNPYKCPTPSSGNDNAENRSRLDIHSFGGLFLITGLTTIIAFSTYILNQDRDQDQDQSERNRDHYHEDIEQLAADDHPPEALIELEAHADREALDHDHGDTDEQNPNESSAARCP